MTAELLLNQNEYNPNRLLDSLIERFHLKNDAALSRALEVTPPVISNRCIAADSYARIQRDEHRRTPQSHG